MLCVCDICLRCVSCAYSLCMLFTLACVHLYLCALSHWSRLWPRLSSPWFEAPAACCDPHPANNAADVARHWQSYAQHLKHTQFVSFIQYLHICAHRLSAWIHIHHVMSLSDTYKYIYITHTQKPAQTGFVFASYSVMFDPITQVSPAKHPVPYLCRLRCRAQS